MRLAAEMIVSSFPANDEAREELNSGVFDIRQMQPWDVFEQFVVFVRKTMTPDQQAKPEVQR
ncbi:hypothetical protein ST27_10090 [Xanthomonas phaseoli pv. phaseoli]|nr:hypothetical protein ST27_10090 [Xanthomonas phaseoli pv. phaseoli]